MDTLIGGLVIVVFAVVGLMLYEAPLAQWGRILFVCFYSSARPTRWRSIVRRGTR
jgi:hypothetical protein